MSREAEVPYLVPAVVNAFRLMETLRRRGAEMSVKELAQATGLNSSTVHKLMLTLAHCGAAARDPRSKRYSLGISLAEYGRVALNGLDFRRAAKPFLDELAAASGETAVLGVLRGSKVVLADKKEPLLEIRVSPFVGLAVPATATAHGVAAMAWMSREAMEEALAREGLPALTPASIRTPEEFRAEVAATRARGYAVDREEFQEGVSGVAAPVLLPSGEVAGTLSIVGPTFRMGGEKIARAGELCVEAAGKLSRLLG